MLDDHFSSTRARHKLRVGPLGPLMDGFAQHLHEQGYTRASARAVLGHVAHWSRYALWSGKLAPTEMTPALATQFLNEHLPSCSCEQMNAGKYHLAGSALTLMMAYLTTLGYLKPAPAPPSPWPEGIATLLGRYDAYLHDLHGLADGTRAIHRRRAVHFLLWWRAQYDARALSTLTAQDLLTYQQTNLAERHSVAWHKTDSGCLRMFLRFLRWERLLTEDLTPDVYTVIQWSLASLPQYISFEEISRLLAMPDTERAVGKRDLAILTLCCLLGLRAGEVVALTLDDIDWAQGQLRIIDRKTRRERIVPLIPEVARVLADYIQSGRPPHASRQVFLGVRAPIGPFAEGSCLWGIVRKYLVQAGIASTKRGPHVLRHSLATHLLNHGVSIKEIADLLGHARINTTAIYAKVHLSRLQDVALPFPGQASGGVA